MKRGENGDGFGGLHAWTGLYCGCEEGLVSMLPGCIDQRSVFDSFEFGVFIYSRFRVGAKERAWTTRSPLTTQSAVHMTIIQRSLQ